MGHMIRQSFIFLEKVGKKKEQSFWKQGIKDWQSFLLKEKIEGISTKAKAVYKRKIQEAQQALLEENSSFFVGKNPAKEMWRLYEQFKEDAGFLDIEAGSRGEVTVVGISNYYETKHLVKGFNLEKEILEKALASFKLLITFNGGAFDLPKLRKEFGIEVNVPHVDLKPLCVNLGLKGGLKEVERILELKRPGHLYGNPVELWKAFHASGDKEYLDLLLHYNAEDCENLKRVMEYCWERMKRKTFIDQKDFKQ
ncbi:ribonuclease H-like domain-containing protein [Candidatus Woesearchaeota archaeon]|nr:ribonuclease H-like domain-containing protein [Candidatus Woesearchaeota archaeon]